MFEDKIYTNTYIYIYQPTYTYTKVTQNYRRGHWNKVM